MQKYVSDCCKIGGLMLYYREILNRKRKVFYYEEAFP